MDKFLYRWIFQTLIKAVLTAIIVILCVAFIYFLYGQFLGPISVKVDYWILIILNAVITAVACFFLIFVKDSYTSSDTEAFSVGSFWMNRIYKGKPVKWIWLRLLIFPMFLTTVWSVIYLYINRADMFLAIEEFILERGNDRGGGLEYLYFKNLLYFSHVIGGVFFFAQWLHVRNFCKAGRCPKCKAAFSMGYLKPGDTTTRERWDVSSKNRSEVVGEQYEVITEDGIEQSRRKVADVYGTVKDYYVTHTTTVTNSHTCCCGFCGATDTKFDSHSTIDTKKI